MASEKEGKQPEKPAPEVDYEVNISADPSVAADFRKWLSDENSTDKNTLYTVVYRIKNRQSLDEYFKNHAPKMRQEALDKFGTKHLTFSRRILTVEQTLMIDRE